MCIGVQISDVYQEADEELQELHKDIVFSKIYLLKGKLKRHSTIDCKASIVDVFISFLSDVVFDHFVTFYQFSIFLLLPKNDFGIVLSYFANVVYLINLTGSCGVISSKYGLAIEQFKEIISVSFVKYSKCHNTSSCYKNIIYCHET